MYLSTFAALTLLASIVSRATHAGARRWLGLALAVRVVEGAGPDARAAAPGLPACSCCPAGARVRGARCAVAYSIAAVTGRVPVLGLPGPAARSQAAQGGRVGAHLLSDHLVTRALAWSTGRAGRRGGTDRRAFLSCAAAAPRCSWPRPAWPRSRLRGLLFLLYPRYILFAPSASWAGCRAHLRCSCGIRSLLDSSGRSPSETLKRPVRTRSEVFGWPRSSPRRSSLRAVRCRASGGPGERPLPRLERSSTWTASPPATERGGRGVDARELAARPGTITVASETPGRRTALPRPADVLHGRAAGRGDDDRPDTPLGRGILSTRARALPPSWSRREGRGGRAVRPARRRAPGPLAQAQRVLAGNSTRWVRTR